MKIRFFDVFDTLLTRETAGSDGAFLLLGSVIQDQFVGKLPAAFLHEFSSIRKEAQALAHEQSEHPEISLDAIYEAINSRYPEVDPEQLLQIKEEETKLEVALCYGIRENIDAVLKELQFGTRILLISDMYLPKATVHEMLEKVEPRLAELPLYLSSEIGKRKADGDLFAHVAEKEGIDPGDIIHIGDNYHSDVLMAQQEGIATDHYTNTAANDIESSYLSEKTGLTGCLYAGASRQARLDRTVSDTSADYTLGATFTGPLFFGFIRWCLEEANARGIQDLYFLARDGHILIEMAKRLQPEIAPDTRLHYLYISRKTTLLASIFQLTDRALDWVFEEMDNLITLERVAERLGTRCETLESILPPELKCATQTRIPQNRIRKIRHHILNHREFRGEVEANAAEARRKLKGYLSCNGIDGSSSFALIDVGWKCTIQDNIYRVLSEGATPPHIVGFYYGCSHYSQLTCGRNAKHPYLITPSNQIGPGPLIELVLMAPHGTTIDYKDVGGGRYEPILKAYNEPSVDWQIGAYLVGVISFVDHLLRTLKKYPTAELYPKAVDKMLLENFIDPPRLLAKVLGNLPYCGDQEESRPRAMAPAFSLSNACKYLVGRPRTRALMTQWLDATKRRSSLPSRLILEVDPRKHMSRIVRSLTSSETQRQKFRQLRQRIKL